LIFLQTGLFADIAEGMKASKIVLACISDEVGSAAASIAVLFYVVLVLTVILGASIFLTL